VRACLIRVASDTHTLALAVDPFISPKLAFDADAFISTAVTFPVFGLSVLISFWPHYRRILLRVNVSPPDPERGPATTEDVIQAANAQLEATAIPPFFSIVQFCVAAFLKCDDVLYSLTAVGQAK
jgi:hypothetical protein